ncbi:MAG: hypothetical protein H7175_18730, partial [Burkholderiales bacterium]|nr:hypothetical protein [Anaerolineae bacterium]
AQARDGHTLFDWAMLEISLLSEVVMPIAGESWDVARLVLRYVDALNDHTDLSTVEGSVSIAAAMASVAAVREIAQTCLADPSDWTEYYTALAMCALRAIMWDTMTIGGRRLQFLVAALAISEVKKGHRTSTDELSPEATDLRDPDSAPPSQ